MDPTTAEGTAEYYYNDVPCLVVQNNISSHNNGADLLAVVSMDLGGHHADFLMYSPYIYCRPALYVFGKRAWSSVTLSLAGSTSFGRMNFQCHTWMEDPACLLL